MKKTLAVLFIVAIAFIGIAKNEIKVNTVSVQVDTVMVASLQEGLYKQ